eukprot:m.100167 g.100167  ORF g.100167 m.100167 type:complete len:82 (+) comp37085_c0_seq6:4801-5046(+)
MGNSKAVESCSIATNRKRNSHYCGSTVVYSYSIYGYSTVCIGPYKVGVVVFGFGAPSAGLPLIYPARCLEAQNRSYRRERI